MKQYVLYRLRLADGQFEYMTDMGWSLNREFATKFGRTEALSVKRCLDNIGTEEVV